MALSSQNSKNIILIGMPGAGKSTVGILLAKQLARSFIDTDVVIQTEEKRSLQDIINHQGFLALRAIEEKIILALSCTKTVIATGGSAIYSERGISHLKSTGIMVYLQVTEQLLLKRIADLSTRGIACRPGFSFSDLYAERTPLYEKFADLTITIEDESHEAVAYRIEQILPD